MEMQNRQQRDDILLANDKSDNIVGENGEQASPYPLLVKA